MRIPQFIKAGIMENVKRNRKIIRLREKGLTYRAIGEKCFGPKGKPLTKQAVEQIYKRDREKYPLSPWEVLMKRIGLRFFGG